MAVDAVPDAVGPSDVCATGGSVAADFDAPGILRRVLGDFARRHGAENGLVARVRLAVSEAATNVAMHAYDDDEAGDLAYAAAADGADLRIVIADQGHGMRADRRCHGAGIGMGVIEMETDEWEATAAVPRGVVLSMRFVLQPGTRDAKAATANIYVPSAR